MQFYCVIGYPISHSLSPKIHNRWFRAAKIAARYEAREVMPGNLAKFMRSFRERYSGANVTIPHKETVLKFLDRLSPEARRIGAVNTIVNRGGKLVGYNTDMDGAMEVIGNVMVSLSNHDLCGKKAIVIGAGGAARAIIYGLCKAGARVVILNRTLLHARKLAREFGCRFGGLEDFEKFMKRGVDLIVNATSVGMEKKVKSKKLNGKSAWQKLKVNGQATLLPQLCEVLKILSKKARSMQSPAVRIVSVAVPTVMDIIYRPRMTRLLRDAASCGCPIITGDKMFLAQAAKSFELWTGKRPKNQRVSSMA